jgi:ankyrin repeat protein
MFPNPQDALPLPPRPNLERYRKLARKLVRACRSDDENTIGDWAEQWIHQLAALAGEEATPRIERWTTQVEEFARRQLLSGETKCALTGAQFVIARSHGFESWPKFAKHLEALAREISPVSRFETAADAIVSGDIATLHRLLGEEPDLARATSMREHGATLLHYTSANGVEAYRQKTPKNIGAIAEMLLNAGAEIDATADVYGGGCTTLGLAATSVHPERAGVQEALLQTLLDHGARLELPPIAGNRHSIVMACIANGRPTAAEFLANRGARLDFAEAAALGRLDIVKGFCNDGGWKAIVSQKELTEGFVFACEYGHNNVVEFLLERGMDLSAHRGDGQTGLHWAVIGGHLETVQLLLRYSPPLEVRNVYGGTVLGQTLWSAAHGGDPDVYIAILEALAAAGARVPERHVPVNPRVDEWLARHGSSPEPSWHWYGEKSRRRK